MSKKTYIVRYTNQECRGNDFFELEIQARDLEEAFDIIDQEYNHLEVDMVFAKSRKYTSEAL
jgi:hypothetical protein